MGYAGYSPGMRVADSLTPLEQALRSLPLEKAQETLELLEKLTRNVVRNPEEQKYRSIKLTNPKMSAVVADAPTMLTVLREMGWEEQDEAMVLPSAVRLLHEVHVVGIIDAKDHFKKAAEEERRRQMRADKGAMADREQILLKMELDRKEKEADGPVTQGSVAKKLGDGPNIMRASDVGIGKSNGGG